MNHPKTAPLLSLAHIACARMGITPENPGVTPDQLPDTLANHAHHPVFPAIAANAGVPPEPLFTTAQTRHANRRILAPEEFIQASYQAFATVPREHLLAAEGAAAGLKTLRL